MDITKKLDVRTNYNIDDLCSKNVSFAGFVPDSAKG